MITTIFTTAHVAGAGDGVLNSRLLRPTPRNLPAARGRHCSFRLNCGLEFPEKRRESRRVFTVALGVLLQWLSLPKDAVAGPFDKYVKRKRLDPLETYVPAVLLAGLQIKKLEKSLAVDQPKYGDCRNLLRAGPASALRVNIRAVAQYADDDGNGKSAFSDVDRCLSALEQLDSLLLQASRNDRGASVDSMKASVAAVLNALDSLLKTVPADMLAEAKTRADSYLDFNDETVEPEKLDPNLKQLESIL